MIKCIAIDDEPLSLDQLKRYIHRIPELQLVGTAYTVSQAKEILSKEKADLLFLDIEMPGESGVDFAKSLLEKYESLSVVFTTAYSQYAIEGFRVDAVDYLLKPLDFNELQIAVDKVKRRIRDASSTFEGCSHRSVPSGCLSMSFAVTARSIHSRWRSVSTSCF